MKPVVLYRNHFQLGYVIRNLEGAMQTMRDRFGVKKWQVNHLPLVRRAVRSHLPMSTLS